MNDPNKEAQPGDILHGKNNRNVRNISPHFIIYLSPSPNSNEEFLGAMLTSSPGFGNIVLNESHFEKNDSSGNEWRVFYKNSHIAPALYQKKNNWRPFTKVGSSQQRGYSLY